MTDPMVELGRLLTSTEASQLAARLDAGQTLTQALKGVPAGRRPEVKAALDAAGLVPVIRELAVPVLRAIEGAALRLGSTTPIWTMPGHLAGYGSLTSSLSDLVLSARFAVTCSTFNVQKSSSLWHALGDVCRRGTVGVRLYLDHDATAESTWVGTPSFAEVAAQMVGAEVYVTRATEGGKHVRNHAKFVAVDHQFLIVTSANQSASAELHNIELGLKVESRPLTELVESELIRVESALYESLPS